MSIVHFLARAISASFFVMMIGRFLASKDELVNSMLSTPMKATSWLVAPRDVYTFAAPAMLFATLFIAGGARLYKASPTIGFNAHTIYSVVSALLIIGASHNHRARYTSTIEFAMDLILYSFSIFFAIIFTPKERTKGPFKIGTLLIEVHDAPAQGRRHRRRRHHRHAPLERDPREVALAKFGREGRASV